MSNHVALAQTKKHTGYVLFEHSTVVNVIVEHLIIEGIPSGQLGIGVLGAYQADSYGPGITDLIILDKVARVVSLNINTVASHGIKVVVLNTAVLCPYYM